MATVPASRAVLAFDATANTLYLTNSSSRATSAFSVVDGVKLTLAEGNLTVTAGSGGSTVFEIDITNKWSTTSFDPSRGMVAVMAIGSGMIETRTRVSGGGSYGTTTSVATYTCDLNEKTLVIKKVGTTLSLSTM